ncbi:uncharacterized protein LOC100879060 [Megachile rotundata]|uniref:uncharacterized protein LOC100879060 n=1 Tax=Megachile rotundata TaxID=143995 RepID=UPI0006152034|nr:PREDICTED: protein lap1-like [Megachile rotundata]
MNMSQELNLVNSFNTLRLTLKNDPSNIVQNKNLTIIKEKGTIEEISDTRQLQIVEKSLLRNQLPHLFSSFTESIINLVYLDLSDNRLNDLPNSMNILKNLTHLSLMSNEFLYLPNVVCELISLKTLKANNNSLREVPSNLENLSKLKELDLSFNLLNNLPSSYANLCELRNLFLNRNNFKRIPSCIADGIENLQIFHFSLNFNAYLNVFPKSRNLNTFYAENNGICPLFPNWILSSKYNKLETVSLNNTKFKEFNLPENLTESYVRKLYIKNCQLFNSIVENIITEMTSLEELLIGNTKFLSKNQFWSVPIEKLKKPSSLKKLNACNTGISTVPDNIGKCVNLSMIDLSCNDLFCLPDAICTLKNLNSLIIHRNQLTTLPENIGELISLKELNVSCNHLYKLPESIEALSNLHYLDLFDNEFEIVPEKIKSLANLVGVDLEQNYFSTDNLSLNRNTSYENMRNDLREHWPEEGRTYNGCKSYLLEPWSDNNSGSVSSSTTTDSSSEHCYNFGLPPENTSNQFANEHWDTSEDSADEFDPHENREPRKQTYSPFTFYRPSQLLYCPAESHQPRIISRVRKMLNDGTLVWSKNFEEGQFEDS